MSKQTYEYVVVPLNPVLNNVQDFLNERAKSGWRLHSVLWESTFIFERKLEEKSDV